MRTHRVIHGRGTQSIVSVAINEQNDPTQPSAATYSIVDLREPDDGASREIVASTAATVNSVSTTTTAAAGPSQSDERLIVVTSATGITEGLEFLISDAGQRELFVVDRVDSLNVYARDKLRRDYTSGASILGVEVTASFPASDADGDTGDDHLSEGGGPFAIDWVWTGVTPATQREIVWLVRHAQRIYATEQDLQVLDQFAFNATRDDLDARTVLEQAHRDFRVRLRELGIDPDLYHGGDQARSAVAFRAAMYIRRALRGDANGELADWYEKQYLGIMNKLSATGAVVTDRLDDDAPAGPNATAKILHWSLT
jgi:hypothetical protein